MNSLKNSTFALQIHTLVILFQARHEAGLTKILEEQAAAKLELLASELTEENLVESCNRIYDLIEPLGARYSPHGREWPDSLESIILTLQAARSGLDEIVPETNQLARLFEEKTLAVSRMHEVQFQPAH